ncbi:MAG: hypothetical protein PVH47_06430 [Thiohalocapsa sp.]
MSVEPRDRLYAAPGAPSCDFVFDERVARVFADMLDRSVSELRRLDGVALIEPDPEARRRAVPRPE